MARIRFNSKNTGNRHKQHSAFLRRLRELTIVSILISALTSQAVFAAGPPVTLPTGGNFVAGTGSFSSSANSLTIRQAVSRGIIDWSTFSIGQGGSVFFNNGTGATLNRVTGGQLSTILGSLSSSGSLYLINSEGVLIGPSGQVRTGGDFVASALNLSNAAFLSGQSFLFTGSSANALVRNLGTISSVGGSVFLIAPTVENHGSLSAPNGTVGLGAGTQILLKDSSSDERIFVQAGTGDVTNTGRIAAAEAELKAANGNIYALAGNNGGQIRATGTAQRNGHVWLVSQGGATAVSSPISAQNQDGSGGAVETSGHSLSLENAQITTGRGGSWLVDPTDLTIDVNAASTIHDTLNGGTNVTLTTSATGASGPGTQSTGFGDINVASSITWGTSSALTLSAYHDINIATGTTIANTSSGSLTLHADNAANGSGSVNFNGTGNVNFANSSGNVSLFYHPQSYPASTNYAGNVTMGTGTRTAYMTVDSMSDLQHVTNNLTGAYALNTNLDGGTTTNFQPIGLSDLGSATSDGFTGVFDGQGHTVNGLTINDQSGVATRGMGLFSQIGTGGIVRNVGVTNGTFTSTTDGVVMGGVVGINYGSVSNSYFTGSISTNVTSPLNQALLGGLAGDNAGTISSSYAAAAVSTSQVGASVGGLVGANGVLNSAGTVKNSYATGAVTNNGMGTNYTGGLVGDNAGAIVSSYSTGRVTGGTTYTGGLVGHSSGTPTIATSYWDTQTSGQTSSGPSGAGTGLTTAQFQNGSLPLGFSSPAWAVFAGSYPVLSWQSLLLSGTVLNLGLPVNGVSVSVLANGTSVGTATTNASGAYSYSIPASSSSVFAYLSNSSYKGNSYSDGGGSGNFSAVNILANTLQLYNQNFGSYSSLVSALSSAVGGTASSNLLFGINSGLLSLNSGANINLFSTSSSLTLDQSINGTGTTLVNSAGNLTIPLGSAVTASGSGTALTLVSGGVFANNAGANALSVAGGGRWLVYSLTPANDSRGGLTYAFKQYNATYGSTVAQATGNGFLYTLAPTLTASLTGSTSKTYDGTTTASLASASYSLSGAVDSDTVTLTSLPRVGSYSDKNVGTGKSVTAAGLTVGSAFNGSATVYGYQLTSPTASGAIGAVTPAQLTYAATSASRAYGSINPAFTGTVSGFMSGDTLANSTAGSAAFASTTNMNTGVGNYAINGSGLIATNYTFAQATSNATALIINPAILTFTANPATRLYGSSNPAFSGTLAGFLNSDTLSSATNGTLAFFSPATAGTGAGNYAINGSGLTASNYTFQQSPANATALTINPALLTYVASSSSRPYGSANAAFPGTVTGFLNGDTLSLATTGALTFTSSASTASLPGTYGITGSGLTAANYTFTQAASNGTALTINPAILTYVASPVSRLYGGANTALTGTVTGFVNGDTLTSATTGTAAYLSSASTSSNVGNYGIFGSGLSAANYTFQQSLANSTALTINPATLTFIAASANRTYGGNNPLFTGGVSGFLNGDTLASATTGTVSFTSPAAPATNVGNYAINGSGLIATNYTFAQAPTNSTALTINPALLNYTADVVNRNYGFTSSVFGGTVTGFLNGDTQGSATSGALSFSSPAGASSSVGFYPVVGSGLTATNYTFAQAATNLSALSIVPEPLLYTAASVSRTYGGGNPASFTGTLTGLVNGDTAASTTTGSMSFSTAATSASNAGSYAINGSGLAVSNSNYTLQQAQGNATAFTINPALLTYTAASASRTYGASDPAYTGTVSGFVNGETLTSATTGTTLFSTPASSSSNVGSYAINGSGLTANNGNYTFAQAASNASALNIDPAILTVIANAQTKTYGTADPTFTYAVSGLVNNDTISTITGSPIRTSGETVLGGPYAINIGNLSASQNYQLNFTGNYLSITPASLIAAINANNKIYDGTTAVTGTLGITSGLVGSDNVGLNTNQTVLAFADKNAATGKVVTQTGTALAGLDASNYTLTVQNGQANITPAALSAAITANGKVYDGTTAAAGTIGSLSASIGNDSVSLNTGQAILAFADKNVGTGKTVSETGATLTGADAGNYTLTLQNGQANITPAALTASVVPNNKIYDGTTAATGTLTLSGRIANDDVSPNTGQTLLAFTDKNVGAGKIVIQAGTTLTGADAGNYTLTLQNGQADITPATLVYAANQASRAFGIDNPAFSGTVTGFVPGENLTNATTGNLLFSSSATSASAIGNYAITGSGLTAVNGNYQFVQNPGNSNALSVTTPPVLQIVVNNTTRLADQPNPQFSASYTGNAISGVDITALINSLTFTTDAALTSVAGAYSVNATTSTAIPGYTISVEPGTLTVIDNSPQTIPTQVTQQAQAATGVVAPVPTVSGAASAPNTLGAYAINYSTNWSNVIGNSISASLSHSSFLPASLQTGAITVAPAPTPQQ